MKKRRNCASTIENKISVISVFTYYIGHIDILKHVKRPPTSKTRLRCQSLDREEQTRVLQVVEQSNKLRNIAMVFMFLYTGLRVSEIVALDRTDVMMEEEIGAVRVRNQSAEVIRQVPLPEEEKSRLQIYLSSREDDHPALFISNFRQRISVRSVQRALQKFGIPRQLRHTFCRELILSGLELATVAELAGHTDMKSTRKYARN